MINKLLSVSLGEVLWGLGTYFNVLVAIEKYGVLAFIAGVILALGLLISKVFQERRHSSRCVLI